MDWIFWLVLVVVLSIIELCTINLVTVWFVISGMVSLILSFFIEDIAVLSTIFVLLGIILLILSRPIINKLKNNSNDTKTNLDRIIGSHGIVTQEIKNEEIGEVKVDGKRWSAISKEHIPVDTKVFIEAIDGVKLIVRKER